MRIRIYRKGNNWHSKLLRYKGGFGSLVEGRVGNLMHCIRILNYKNILKLWNKK